MESVGVLLPSFPDYNLPVRHIPESVGRALSIRITNSQKKEGVVANYA